MEESDYQVFVKKCYKQKLDKEIHNASTENALLLFQTLLDKAIRDKEDVRIISQTLLASFYNQLTTKIQQIINNGNSVSIIVEGAIDDKNNNSFYQKLQAHILSAKSKFDSLPNFIVVGNSAYRYEKNKKTHLAIANFNNLSMGDYMKEMFDDLKSDISKP